MQLYRLASSFELVLGGCVSLGWDGRIGIQIFSILVDLHQRVKKFQRLYIMNMINYFIFPEVISMHRMKVSCFEPIENGVNSLISFFLNE